MTSRDFQARLGRRARRAGVGVATDLAARLEAYYRLLATWNEKINLAGMALAEPTPEALDRLLIEPLVAARYAPPGIVRVLDIGSGGGSPALPFALALPQVSLRMVEAKARKSVFLREAIRVLELPSATVIASRFEELLTRPDLREQHELLTIRAVRVEARTLSSLQSFLKPGGQMFLFRGAVVADLPDALRPPLVWRATYPLVESLGSHLVVLEKRRLKLAELRRSASAN